MTIFAFYTDVPGQIGQNPRRVKLITSDNLSTITTAGYLNNLVKSEGMPLLPTDIIDCWYGATSLSVPGTYESFTLSINGSGVITLVQWTNPGDILLPVVSGDFATFNGTTGQIKDAGYLPSDTTKTKVVMAGSAVQTGYIAHFVDTSGTIDDTAGTVQNDGSIQAGKSGTAGTLTSFPGTAANGSLIVAATNAGGAFNTTISNGTMGQSTVYTMGDIGASTGGLVVATSAIRMKSVAQAAVAGGAAAQTVTDAFCTTGSCVVASWNDTTNAVTIQKVAAGNGSFVVTSSGDPGASHLNYIITK